MESLNTEKQRISGRHRRRRRTGPHASAAHPYPLHEEAAFRERAPGRTVARMKPSAEHWAELVREWETSGQSGRQFAEARAVTEASLRWWKRELARRARPSEPAPKTVTLARVVRKPEDLPAPADAPAPHVVVMVGRARIVVEREFDAPLLRAVVHALGEAS